MALTNANFKTLSEHFGFRSCFGVVCIQVKRGELAKCVQFNKNSTRTQREPKEDHHTLSDDALSDKESNDLNRQYDEKFRLQKKIVTAF